MEPGTPQSLELFSQVASVTNIIFSKMAGLPEAGSEMSILIKHFTFNYISQFANGDDAFITWTFQSLISTVFWFRKFGENNAHMKKPSFFLDFDQWDITLKKIIVTVLPDFRQVSSRPGARNSKINKRAIL